MLACHSTNIWGKFSKNIHGKFTVISKMCIAVLAKPVYLDIHGNGKADDLIVY